MLLGRGPVMLGTWSGYGVMIDIKRINSEFENKSTEEFLKWALDRFSPKIALASSFGAEDVVLIDMLLSIDAKAAIFTLDTGRLNEETYEVMDRIRSKYKISIQSYFPVAARVEALERTKGFYSFRESIENKKECCPHAYDCRGHNIRAIVAKECPCPNQDFCNKRQLYFELGKYQRKLRKNEPSNANADDNGKRKHEYRIHHGRMELGCEQTILCLLDCDQFQIFSKLS